jgi:hypothetical protein
MKKHIPVFALTALSALVNLVCFLTAESFGFSTRSGALAMVSILLFVVLFAMRDLLPPSRVWTRTSALWFSLGVLVIEVAALTLDYAQSHAMHIGASTGLALHCSMLLLFQLNAMPSKANRKPYAF